MSVELNIAWWNANDLFHFDPDKSGEGERSRWPNSRQMYQEKCRRVDAALQAMFSTISTPELLLLGETTRQAAHDLRDRLLPSYRVRSLDVLESKPTLQVAILYAPDVKAKLKFREIAPIIVPGTPRGTRPMAVIDIESIGAELRCIGCHWQARLDDGSELTRFRIADYLAQYAHDYLAGQSDKVRSVVIVGDLNEEPFSRALEFLNAHRYRSRAKGRTHWADVDVKRTHLYNTSWRLMGERYASPEPALGLKDFRNSAGTYYWESEKAWAHLDHFIVSGSLLGATPPYIDESRTSVVCLPEFLTDGLPIKFSRDGAKFRGVSDHLPIFGRFFL